MKFTSIDVTDYSLPPPFILIPQDPDCYYYTDTKYNSDSITEIPELESPVSVSLDLGTESPASIESALADDDDDTSDEWKKSGIAMNTHVPMRSRTWRSSSFSRGKQRAREVLHEEVDRDCGICFDPALKPTRTRCCGALFCLEHLSDWLNGPSSDGCCPSCKTSCSIHSDTVSLASPSSLISVDSKFIDFTSSLPTKSQRPLSPETAHTPPERSVSCSPLGLVRREPPTGLVALLLSPSPVPGPLSQAIGRILGFLGFALVLFVLYS